jgi:hypothetical protein
MIRLLNTHGPAASRASRTSRRCASKGVAATITIDGKSQIANATLVVLAPELKSH